MYHATEPKMIAKEVLEGLHSAQTDEGIYMSGSKQDKNKSKEPQLVKVESRFGEVEVDVNKAILFPVGLLGMPDKHHFALTDFPSKAMEQFKLLQSLDEANLSFITLPIQPENAIIAYADIQAAAKDMEIPMEDIGIVLIVSVHRGINGVQLSVNARAPIFFDAERRAAAQYVFTSNKYKIQHFITQGWEGEQPAAPQAGADDTPKG